MDKQLKKFNNTEFELEVLIMDGVEYFPATESAKMLGYANPHKAIKDHCKGVNEMLVPTKGGEQKKNYITEGNLYRLIINSKLTSAEKFESWVFEDVLPSIRKTGGYIPIDENMSDSEIMARALQISQKTIQRKDKKIVQLEEKIEADKSKVLFSEAVENSKDLILVKEMATIITQSGFKIGQNELFEYLRKYNYLCSKKGGMYHLPTKKYEHLFKVTKRNIQHTSSIEVANTPKVNGKGQIYFVKKFAEYKLKGLSIKDLLAEQKEAM